MTSQERWREPITEVPSAEAAKSRMADGWKPVAIEWERTVHEAREASAGTRPIPYGLRISPDCRHLEVDPTEKKVVEIIVAMIAGDHPLSKIAEELNGRGYTMREGTPWNQVSIFRLLPRVIEVGPEILSRDEWSASKKNVLAAVG